VIDLRLDGRLQAWALIEIVQCQTTKADHGFEQRAMSVDDKLDREHPHATFSPAAQRLAMLCRFW
jgi:hypothetical protein